MAWNVLILGGGFGGLYAARKLERALPPHAAKVTVTLGVFVDMGHQKAVAETVGIKWRGFPACFLARTYHLAMMPGIKRQLRLVVDWTVDLMFGRDTSELGQLGHPPLLEAPAAHAHETAAEPTVPR